MNTRDNIQAELQVLRMENVRLTNELAKRNEYVSFLEDENKAVEEETRNEYETKLALMKKERAHATGKVNEAESEAKTVNTKVKTERMCADHAEQMPREARKVHEERNKRISVLSKQVKTLVDLKEVADAADKAVLDAKQVVELINRSVFQRNRNATRFLNGEIDPNCPLLEENGLVAIVKHVMAVTSGKDRNGIDDSAKKKTDSPKVRVPRQKTDKSKPFSDTESNTPHRRRVYTATILEEMGIDISHLPNDSKLINRKDMVTDEDAWYIQLFFHTLAKVTCRGYRIGRFNGPNIDPMSIKNPVRILLSNVIMPKFTRF